jgi:glucose/arabinose dehydrogenase
MICRRGWAWSGRVLGCRLAPAGMLLMGWGGGLAVAGTTNLAVVADTFLLAESGNNNAGASTHVAVGANRFLLVRRALLRFDLGGIPSGSVVTSATMRAEVIGLPAFATPQSSQFALHRLHAAWGEGSRAGNQGALAQAGDATWNSRMHGTALWTQGGAAADAAATASATTLVAGLGMYAWSGPGLVEDVQAWIDDPATNAGWLLMSQSEATAATAKQLGSREGGKPMVLEVGFLPPVEEPEVFVQGVSVDSNRNVALTWAGAPGWQYDLLADANLGDDGDFPIAYPNIRDSGTGTNTLADLPALVHPNLPGNDGIAYAIQARPLDTDVLSIALEPVATNLTSPVLLTYAADGSGRLFVVEQTGEVLIIDSNRTVLAEPFLDLSDRLADLAPNGIGDINDPGLNPIFDERGLLGLAFHPQYAENGRFFVYHSAPKSGDGINHESIVAEYHVSAADPNVADPASERVLLRQDQPEFNHNAGQLVFGPDGYLYIGFGDGGGGGDQHGPFGNAQLTSTWLGSILRIDVDGEEPYAVPPDNPFVGQEGLDEIYAYGLRNPYRFSFDRGGDHTLIVPDVGQAIYEEINFVVAGGNYGWRILEGHHAFDLPLAETLGVDVRTDLQFPIHEYSHAEAGISIIGGFLYRGSQYPELVGRYVFGDYSASFGSPGGRLYYLEETRPGIWERFQFHIAPDNPPLGRFLKAFGEDADGEVYALTSTLGGPTGNTGEVLLLRKP